VRPGVLLGSFALLLAGCASAPAGRWYGPSDPQQRAADKYECLRASSLRPGAPIVIPGVSTTVYGGNVATTIPGMPLVLPGPPDRDSEIYDACLRSKGWEYRVVSAPRPLSEVVAALDAAEAAEAKQPKWQEPHPVPETPSDPHPTTATAGTPWRLVLIEKEGKGSERVFGHRFKTEPECEAIALHFYRPRGYWFRCELEAATIAPWQPPVFEEPPKPQAAPTTPTAGNTEQSPPPEPARQPPHSVPAKYWRIVATSLVAGPQEVCERAATKARE
jgi:hypothetical protein